MNLSRYIARLKARHAPNSQLTIHDLLSRGYLPQELPPPFSSESFATKITANGIKLPTQFTQKKNSWCGYTPYSLARPGTLRRRLAILNPLAYYRLSKEIVDYQEFLFKKASPSVICLSHPKISPSPERAIATHAPLGKLPVARAKARVGQRFLLRTDVARFYPSIYTHSLDWAITGKAKAKFGPGVNRLGARIDGLVQAAQNGQTRGIPIGPDTSLLLAHVLLAPVDQALQQQEITRGFRFLDDYELSFETRSEAEEALATLEDALADYELELNSRKTSIEELPIEIEDSAFVTLRNLKFRGETKLQSSSLLAFFNAAFAFAKNQPDKPILRFAVGRINNFQLPFEDPGLAQDLVLQSTTIEPGVWRRAIPLLLRLHAKNSLPEEPIRKVVDVIIRQQAPRRHSSEVAWALWAALVFKLELSLTSAKAVIGMQDDVCGLLLLHLKEEGLTKFDSWCIKQIGLPATSSELYGGHWLISYEAVAKGWIAPPSGNYLSSDDVFGFLAANSVRFYEKGALETTRNSIASGHVQTSTMPYPSDDAVDALLNLLDDAEDPEKAD